MNERAIVIDFEQTLANTDHRESFRGKWDEYYALIKNDEPIEAMIELTEHLSSEYEIIVITTTPEKYRQSLNDWIMQNAVHCDEILMRPANEYLPEDEMKIQLISDRFSEGEVFIVFDDTENTVRSLRDMGYTVMEVGR